MNPGEQPVAGSLSARIIRKCPVHRNCPLTCKQRRVEELGEIAAFDMRVDETKSLAQRIRTWFHAKGAS